MALSLFKSYPENMNHSILENHPFLRRALRNMISIRSLPYLAILQLLYGMLAETSFSLDTGDVAAQSAKSLNLDSSFIVVGYVTFSSYTKTLEGLYVS